MKDFAGMRGMLLHHVFVGVDFLQHDVVSPQIRQVLQDRPGLAVLENPVVRRAVLQEKAAVAGEIDIDDVDPRIGPADVVFACQLAANTLVAPFVVDRRNQDPFAQLRIVVELEQPPLADQVRAQELADEALVPVVGPDAAQNLHRIPRPAISGNHSRSSSVGLVTIRSISCIMAKPSA